MRAVMRNKESSLPGLSRTMPSRSVNDAVYLKKRDCGMIYNIAAFCRKENFLIPLRNSVGRAVTNKIFLKLLPIHKIIFSTDTSYNIGVGR